MAHNQRTITVIPAAGVSARWGGVAKALAAIEWRGKVQTMLEHAIGGTPVGQEVVVGTTENLFKKMAGVLTGYSDTGLDVGLLSCGESTRGQADTIGRILLRIEPRDSVLVANVDNVFQTEDLLSLGRTAAMFDAVCAILVHESRDLSCSFVDNVLSPRVFLEKPKVRPSPFAMSGAWWFRSAGELAKAIKLLSEQQPSGEVYLSQALGLLPGRKVCVPVTADRVVDWGLPQKVEESGARIVDDGNDSARKTSAETGAQ